MARTTVNLDLSILRKSMMTTIPQLKALGSSNIQRRFEAAKRDSLDVFHSHPITQDLGSSSFNPHGHSSRMIEGSSAYANLFNVLGFDYGQDPVSDLQDFLEYDAFNFDKNEVTAAGLGNSRVILNYFLSFASLEDTDEYSEFLLEWNDKSWLRFIEEGINNVEFFLQKDNYGRSTGGIQSKNKINEAARFIPEKYYSLMIEAFLKRFSL